MKHKCAANGCAKKGIYLCHEEWGAYCATHATSQRWYAIGQYGPVHEGKKSGKPRAWRQTAAQKGNAKGNAKGWCPDA